MKRLSATGKKYTPHSPLAHTQFYLHKSEYFVQILHFSPIETYPDFLLEVK